MKYPLFAILTALTACAGPTTVQDRPVRVNVPVAVPCRLASPAPVQSLSMLYPVDVWKAMDVRMKAAAVGKWALELRGYSEQLNAATAACP